jgi:hypothetical protein
VTPTIPPPTSLIPLFGHPDDDPRSWRAARGSGAGTMAIVGMSVAAARAIPPAQRVPRVSVPAPLRTPRWISLCTGIERLLADGALPLGYVSLDYAIRPLSDLLAEIGRWTALPVQGVFLDHAPAGPYQIGPVIQAVRAARRGGLTTVVLNPGCATDPLYRRLGVTICTFEGSWGEYRAWSGDGSAPGDGHLIYGVPADDVAAARTEATRRRAGVALVSESVLYRQSTVLSGLASTGAGGAAGSAGRSRTTGS